MTITGWVVRTYCIGSPPISRASMNCVIAALVLLCTGSQDVPNMRSLN